MEQRWVVAAKSADFNQIAEEFGIDPVTARLIRNREVVGSEAIEEYLHGNLSSLSSPDLFLNMKEAIQIVKDKIEAGKKIRIIGDYDIDGVCSTYILLQGLKRVQAAVDVDIPDRIKDGYGVNEELIKLALDAQVDTIITCDNGISAVSQIAFAKEHNMTVIVTDHHEVPYEEKEDKTKEWVLPPADAVVNPKQQNCPYPFKGLCGAGVAFQFVRALYAAFEIDEGETEEFLPFAAIATVGDVMDLTGENRILVKEGLKRLQNTQHIGLRELIKANQLEGKEISSYHIGFILGPCMNASGRLSTAKRALELLLCQDAKDAARLAGDLKALNDSRKQMTAEGVEKAAEMIETTDLKEDKVLVIYLPNCHESLAGIIAGRIREKYGKPVFVFTNAEDGVKGSGRSIEGYHMFEALLECKELLGRFGGHPMAAGLSLPLENLPVLQRKLNENCRLSAEDFVTKVVIDVPMPIAYITTKLIGELSLLEPFGKGNTKPVFAQKNIKLMGCRIFGKNRNVVKMQAYDENGFGIDAVYFGDGEEFVERLKEKERFSVTYYPSVDRYMGRESLQIVIQNVQ